MTTDLMRYEIRAEDMFGNPQIAYRDNYTQAVALANRATDNDASYISILDNETGEVIFELDNM